MSFLSQLPALTRFSTMKDSREGGNFQTRFLRAVQPKNVSSATGFYHLVQVNTKSKNNLWEIMLSWCSNVFSLVTIHDFLYHCSSFLLMHCGVFHPSINFYMSGCPRWNGTRILQMSGNWHFVKKKEMKAKKSGGYKKWQVIWKNIQCDRQNRNYFTSEDKYRTSEHRLKLSQCKRAHHGILEGGISKEHQHHCRERHAANGRTMHRQGYAVCLYASLKTSSDAECRKWWLKLLKDYCGNKSTLILWWNTCIQMSL